MNYVISALLPIFGLILIGFLCRRTGCLGETAASELNRVVVWICLPALLFKSTATAAFEEIWQPDFILVVTLGTFVVFGLTVIYKLKTSRTLVDASLDGLGASYANTGYVGIPLCIFVLGDTGMMPALIATLIVVCILFSLAIILIEVGLKAELAWHDALIQVLIALAKNPIVVTPLLGIMWNSVGTGLPESVDSFLELLGSATIPCALISLGAFLARKPTEATQGTMGLVTAKLIIHPLITWVLAYHVFHLPPVWAKAAVLLSALPTGTGPYMLAEFYGRDASIVSKTIFHSTLVSTVTISACLFWLN